MDDEMLTVKTKTAIDKFFNLNGETYMEKKKSLNAFEKTLRSEYSFGEVQDFISNLITTTEYDRSLKAEIIVRFQLDLAIIETLKSGDEVGIGKVLKNWVFFKNLFNKISIDDFVDNFLPQLSYKTSIKVIKVIGKNLSDSEFADNLFNKLEEKIGIKTATLLLHNCSLYLIKDKCSQYRLKLSSRCLLLIYKNHPSFMFYYFDLMSKQKQRHFTLSSYKQVFKYIAKTNLKLFWELYSKHQFYIKIGKRRAKKLLPTQEVMIKYGFEHKHLFKGKHIVNAAMKLNLHKELIFKSFPDDLNVYIRNSINPHTTSNILYMPKNQIFPLLQELFERKYKEDFRNYVSLMSCDFLRFVTINEREYILDRISDNKENYLCYYPINRSIPILKDKLKSANDPTTRLKLICALYETCNVNKSAKSLLEVLKFVYDRYKNDTTALDKVLGNIVKTWKDYSEFTQEHWEMIQSVIEYLGHSGVSANWDHFFQRRFMWLIDNNKSYQSLMDEYMERCITRKSLGWNYYFNKSLRHMKIFIEEIHKRLPENDYNFYFYLLHLVVEFDKKFPNEINILDFAYILEYGIKHGRNQQTNHEFYFIKNYNKDGSFNNYIKYFDQPYHIEPKIVLYCLKNCPEELDNFHNIHKKMNRINNKIRHFLLCPYFVKKHLPAYNKLCLEQLETAGTNIEVVLIHFFSYDEKFGEIIPKFLPPENAKIEPKTDNTHISKQQEIIKYIPQIPTPLNMELIRIFCKGDYLKFALGSLYKIAYKIPQNLLPEFLQNIFEAAVSVKKHALYLGRHLLPVNLYYDFLVSSSQLETNLSIRNILLKKIIEYFIENVDEKFFNLFITNLEKIDKNDKDLYDYLIDYSKIPQEFISKYITAIYDNIMSNENEDIVDKGYYLMDDLPDHVMNELSIDLMERYIKTVDLNTNRFLNKCLFHTTGEKHSKMYEFIMNLINELLKKYVPTNNELRKEITTVISNITDYATCCNNIKIIENLNTIFKSNVQHTLITTKFKLEFNLIFLQSKKDPKKFAENIKPHLLETIEIYTSKMIGFYKKTLHYFIGCLQQFDKFLFIRNFFNDGNENAIVYLIVIGLLPSNLPTERNIFVNYLPILEKLKLSDDPKVIAELDLYFQNVNCNS
nr:uncharacterized protein LOC111415782 [Onthophagus taurus]